MKLNQQDTLDNTPIVRMHSNLPSVTKTNTSDLWQCGSRHANLETLKSLKGFLYTDIKYRASRTDKSWTQSIYQNKTQIVQIPAIFSQQRKTVMPTIKLNNLDIQLKKVLSKERPQRHSFRNLLSQSVANNILFSFVSPKQKYSPNLQKPLLKEQPDITVNTK